MAELHLRLSDHEKAALERLAARQKITISALVRQRLMVDLTGEALAQRIAQIVEPRAGQADEKVLAELAAHREDFKEFRGNLARELESLVRQVWAASRGHKEPT